MHEHQDEHSIEKHLKSQLDAQEKGVKYDIMIKERCPLCEEDINVGTAGPMGLAQHRGKKTCLATVKRKKQDAVMKKPTLLHMFVGKRRAHPLQPTLQGKPKGIALRTPLVFWSAR